MRETAEALAAEGHCVEFIDARQDYRGGQGGRKRMHRELAALWSILVRALARPRADVVVSGSSPPCMLVVATLVALWHRARSVHWAMDLYPELALALGEIREGIVIRAIERLMAWCYRACSEVVVLDADMAERIRLYGV